MTAKFQFLLPVHNGMPYLPQTVYSMFCDQPADIEIEIHICDSGSKDESRDFLTALNEKNIFVHFLNGATREDNWNFLSRFVNGDFVRLVCADDLVKPSSVTRAINLLNAHPSADLVAGPRDIIDTNGKVIMEKFGKRNFKANVLLEGPKEFKKSITQGANLFGEPSNITFRSSAYLAAGPWSDKNPFCLDLDFYSRVLSRSNFVFDSQSHSAFRIHKNSSSLRTAKRQTREFLEFYIQLSLEATKKRNVLQEYVLRLRLVVRNIKRRTLYLLIDKPVFDFLLSSLGRKR